jgi:hypothetical protein
MDMATLNQVREVLRRQPFRPFQLRLADGTGYTVKHHDFMAIPPGNLGMEAYLYTKGDRPGEYTSRWIDLLNVVDIIAPAPGEPAPSTSSHAEGN